MNYRQEVAKTKQELKKLEKEGRADGMSYFTLCSHLIAIQIAQEFKRKQKKKR